VSRDSGACCRALSCARRNHARDERVSGTNERIGWGGSWPFAMLCGAVPSDCCPGGLNGRDARGGRRAGTTRAERGYPAQRPRAGRGRSTIAVECGRSNSWRAGRGRSTIAVECGRSNSWRAGRGLSAVSANYSTKGPRWTMGSSCGAPAMAASRTPSSLSTVRRVPSPTRSSAANSSVPKASPSTVPAPSTP